MNEYQNLVIEIIELNSQNKLTLDNFKNIKREFSKKNKLSDIPTNIKLLRTYHQLLKEKKIKKDIEIENLFKKRAIRSESGIVAVQVLTKPFYCPGKCIFCPNEVWMPKSYISTEPWAMRALLNQFDPIKQVYNRLISLTMTGHQTDKIEMIVLWGTRDVYPKDYKIDFIKSLYDACNTFSKLEINIPDEISAPLKKWDSGDLNIEDTQSPTSTLKTETKKSYWYNITNLDQIKYSSSIQEAIKINESADHRIIWLTVETRPEFITDKNCRFWRELWVTRLEIGVQSMYDDVLEANKRWHSVEQIRDWIHKLRQYGFKFSVHIMPWLYKSNYDKDLWTFHQIYSDPFIKSDEIKFYPTSVIPNTKLYDLYISWKYKALTTEHIQKLIKDTFQNIIPPYTRIKRLIRDIPATEIAAGSNITNLAQLTHNALQKELRADSKKAQELYSRLYWDYKLFDSLEAFIKKVSFWTKWRIHCSQKLDSSPRITAGSEWQNDGSQWQDIETYIVWQSPDLISYRNFVTLDTRSREIRQKSKVSSLKLQDNEKVNLIIRKYKSSVWTEYFISFEDLQWYLYWFTRLLLPNEQETIDREWLWKDTALIRELHIYGQLASLKSNIDSKDKKQHKWFWSQLMDISEQISKKFWYKKLSVISWVWVRWFYQKIWYWLEWTYMVKAIDNW